MRLRASKYLPLLFLLLDCSNIIRATKPTSALASVLSMRWEVRSIPTKDRDSISFHSSKSIFWVAKIIGDLRGGGKVDYDDGDDTDESYEYDSEEESESSDEEIVIQRGNMDKKMGPDRPTRHPYTSRPHTRYNSRNPYKEKQKTSSHSSLSGATSAASAASKLATKSLSMTGSLAWNALVKQPGKLAFHLIRPKHVDLVETFGLWRLDQQVIERSNRRGDDHRTIASVATVEFVRPPQPPNRKQGRPHRGMGTPRQPFVVVRHSRGESNDDKDGAGKDIVYRAPYTFVRKNKYLKGASLSSFQTSFIAPAFLVGENQTRLYGYKGTWQRKLADKSVIKLKGKIYQVHKQRFGKKRGEYVYGPAVGTFVMRRRISISDEDYEDLDESDTDDSDNDEFEYDREYDDDMEEYTDNDNDEYE